MITQSELDRKAAQQADIQDDAEQGWELIRRMEARQALENAQVARPMYAERESDGRFAPRFEGEAGWKTCQKVSAKNKALREKNEALSEQYGFEEGDILFA